MVSSLGLAPTLECIVNSSNGMLGCEAGSLFLAHEDTGEYVFSVAGGRVWVESGGQRPAMPDTG